MGDKIPVTTGPTFQLSDSPAGSGIYQIFKNYFKGSEVIFVQMPEVWPD
jgi:hypothetical protein